MQTTLENTIAAAELSNADLLGILRIMETSRECDRREGILMRQGSGWFHVGAMGHEPLAALASLLRPDDFIFPYYRDRPLAMARGFTIDEMALSYYARAEASDGGR